MPVIKVQSVSTFSSEDVKHPASNLLSSDTYRKWKCASAAEKKAVVVLQVRSIWKPCPSLTLCAPLFAVADTSADSQHGYW